MNILKTIMDMRAAVAGCKPAYSAMNEVYDLLENNPDDPTQISRAHEVVGDALWDPKDYVPNREADVLIDAERLLNGYYETMSVLMNYEGA